MKEERNGDTIVSESYLEVRAKLLEIAAAFDRVDRATGDLPLGEPAAGQRQLLHEATEILLSDSADRAERLQRLFSRDYESDWRKQFGLNQQR